MWWWSAVASPVALPPSPRRVWPRSRADSRPAGVGRQQQQRSSGVDYGQNAPASVSRAGRIVADKATQTPTSPGKIENTATRENEESCSRAGSSLFLNQHALCRREADGKIVSVTSRNTLNIGANFIADAGLWIARRRHHRLGSGRSLRVRQRAAEGSSNMWLPVDTGAPVWFPQCSRG